MSIREHQLKTGATRNRNTGMASLCVSSLMALPTYDTFITGNSTINLDPSFSLLSTWMTPL